MTMRRDVTTNTKCSDKGLNPTSTTETAWKGGRFRYHALSIPADLSPRLPRLKSRCKAQGSRPVDITALAFVPSGAENAQPSDMFIVRPR